MGSHLEPLGLGISDNNHVQITNSEKSSTCEDVPSGCSVFTDDILPVILDNLKILTSTDLLNFRLVNRCWRDAATKILLKRNACNIILDIGQVPYNGCDVNIHSHAQLLKVASNDDANYPPNFKYYNARPPHSLLPDLIQLISASPKFPSKSIKFHPGCEKALKNLGSSPANENYHFEEDELMKFFSIFGKKIQKLSIPNKMSASSVQNLLFVHLPNLTLLDLANFNQFEQQQEINWYHLSPTLKIEQIHLGSEPMLHLCKAKLLKEVVSFSPNLRVIKDVDMAGFLLLMKMRKAHLIKCLNFNPPENLELVNSLVDLIRLEDKFSFLKLTALSVNLGNKRATAQGEVTWILNKILKGSQNTLKYLELHVNPDEVLPNIQIPPMRNLFCLKLVKKISPFMSSWNDSHVFQFENSQNPTRIPLDYFPALSKVMLDVGQGTLDNNKLLAFFEMEDWRMDGENDISGDIVSSVTTLEINGFANARYSLGKSFPNVRHLKIKMIDREPFSELPNWVWKEFPKLERFEICDFDANWNAAEFDCFITGIHEKLCTKFADKNQAATGLEFSPQQIHFLRTEPFIGECANLKEFTIHFKEKISHTFMSKLTGLHGFRGMVDRTKIIFSFEAVQLNEQDKKENLKHLEHFLPYIEVQQ